MERWWWLGACITAFLWSAYLDVRHHSERHLAAWWVARRRALRGWSGPASLLLSLGALGCFSVAAWTADRAGAAMGNHLWALVVVVPAVLAYAPLVMATAPTQASADRAWQSELGDAGADARQQRGIAWWAGPPSLARIVAIGMALWAALVP